MKFGFSKLCLQKRGILSEMYRFFKMFSVPKEIISSKPHCRDKQIYHEFTDKLKSHHALCERAVGAVVISNEV